jgi:nucleoside-diphosphate-sugar epimerase
MEKNMTKKTALVIGATGSFGGAVMCEMLERGWEIRAMVRNVEKARERIGERAGLEFVAGDALKLRDMREAAVGCGCIVYGFNVPYEKWDPLALRAAEILCEVAARQQALVLFPGNVYGLGPDYEAPLAEDASRRAPTRKGEIRNEIEAMLGEATRAEADGHGARAIVIRCGDFFGPTSEAWLDQIVQKALKGGPIRYPGPGGVLHEWAYLPDVARVAVELAERDFELDAFEVFHFEGYHVDRDELAAAIRTALGDPARRVKNFPWWLIRLASPFAPFLRELLEMRYLWQEPVRLDGSKLRAFLGGYRVTPLDEAIGATLQARYAEAGRSE